MAHVLLIGAGDFAEEVREALEAAGARVSWLREPSDEAVREALGSERPDVVSVVDRGDAMPLRLALLVRHLDEDVPLVVTIFDPAIAREVTETVPRCRVAALADIVAPTLAAPCIDPELVAVRAEGEELVALRAGPDGNLRAEPFEREKVRRVRALATSVLVPYDRSAALLFYGFMVLVAMLLFEAVGAILVLDQPVPDAIYGATKSLVTVGPNDAVSDGPSWFKIAVAASMIVSLLAAACFTGGLINRFVDSRLTGLIGRRAVPRRDHVIVVGLGQVGLRLCLLLRECGVAVVAVDSEADGENVGLARRLKLPVVIGRGANQQILRSLSLPRARAFAAVTPDDLDNIQAAAGARAFKDDLQVVVRAGDGELAEETRSLERIGHPVDVNRLGAAYLAGVILGADALGIAVHDGRPMLLLADGRQEPFPLEIAR